MSEDVSVFYLLKWSQICFSVPLPKDLSPEIYIHLRVHMHITRIIFYYISESRLRSCPYNHILSNRKTKSGFGETHALRNNILLFPWLSSANTCQWGGGIELKVERKPEPVLFSAKCLREPCLITEHMHLTIVTKPSKWKGDKFDRPRSYFVCTGNVQRTFQPMTRRSLEIKVVSFLQSRELCGNLGVCYPEARFKMTMRACWERYVCRLKDGWFIFTHLQSIGPARTGCHALQTASKGNSSKGLM